MTSVENQDGIVSLDVRVLREVDDGLNDIGARRIRVSEAFDMILWDAELVGEVFDYGIGIGDTAREVRQLIASILVGVDADGEREQGWRCIQATKISLVRWNKRMKHTFRSPLAAAEDQKDVVDLGKTSCLCRQYAADYRSRIATNF